MTLITPYGDEFWKLDEISHNNNISYIICFKADQPAEFRTIQNESKTTRYEEKLNFVGNKYYSFDCTNFVLENMRTTGGNSACVKTLDGKSIDIRDILINERQMKLVTDTSAMLDPALPQRIQEQGSFNWAIRRNEGKISVFICSVFHMV